MNKDLGCVDMNLAVRENSTVFKQGELNVHPCGISHDVICSMCEVDKNSFKIDLANCVERHKCCKYCTSKILADLIILSL